MRVSTAAKSLVINQEGKILLLTRSSTDEHRPGGYDFPGGEVEPGEDFKIGVAREVREEAGIDIDPSQYQLIYSKTEHDVVRNLSLNRLLFAVHVQKEEVTLSHEHSDFAWHTASDVLELFKHEFYSAGLTHALQLDLLHI